MLISFDGLDGSGKSVQAELLRQKLSALGISPALYREPGGTRLGEQLRDLLLHRQGQITPQSELLLFEAARAQLVEECIRPALAAGKIVLLDRYADATWAYQGALGLGDDVIGQANRIGTCGVWPDITFILDLPVEAALSRLQGRRDAIEAREPAYFEKVRERFLQLAALDPHRIRIIDANQEPETVADEIWMALSGCLSAAAR